MKEQTKPLLKSEMLLLSGELEDRIFLKEKNSRNHTGFNIDYVVWVENHGDYKRERSGGLLKTTSQDFRYSVEGRVFFKPLYDSELHGEDDWRNFNVGIAYCLGEAYGATVKSSHKTEQEFSLGKRELRKICQENFPYMGLSGNLTLTTIEQLPGDMSLQDLASIIEKSITTNSGFKRLSAAHNAFLNAYLPEEK